MGGEKRMLDLVASDGLASGGGTMLGAGAAFGWALNLYLTPGAPLRTPSGDRWASSAALTWTNFTEIDANTALSSFAPFVN